MLQAAIPVHNGVVADDAGALNRHALLDFDGVAKIDGAIYACVGRNLHIRAQNQIAAPGRRDGARERPASRKVDRLPEGLGQPDFAADQVGAGPHILPDCAHITPIPFGDISMKWLALSQKIREKIGGKVIGNVVGDVVEDGGVEDVDAGVDPVGAGWRPSRVFQGTG